MIAIFSKHCYLLAKSIILDNTTGEVVNEIDQCKENIFDKIKKLILFTCQMKCHK